MIKILICRLAAEARANTPRFISAQDAALAFTSHRSVPPSAPPQRVSLIDDLVLEYASPCTQQLLKEYEAQNQARNTPPLH